MQITINTPLSDDDRTILQGILGGVATVEPVAIAEVTPAKAAPAKKAAAKAAPEPEPEEEDEDLVGGAPTIEEATALATKLVSEGKAAELKAALAKVGAKRVSVIEPSRIAEFIAALPS